jgi:DNA-binding response OmpR family regulator
MRRQVLLVAPEVELRARIARELQACGYAVELASDLQRALRLAADRNFLFAIVAPGSSPAGLAMLLELRDTVPEMIVLAKEADDVVPLRRSLPGLDATFLEKSNIGALISRVGDLANRVIRGLRPFQALYAWRTARWT